jgi:hypothetical protein
MVVGFVIVYKHLILPLSYSGSCPCVIHVYDVVLCEESNKLLCVFVVISSLLHRAHVPYFDTCRNSLANRRKGINTCKTNTHICNA